MTARIGLIGVGTLGDPVARHLVAAGHDVRLYNRTRAKAEAVAGASAADTAEEIFDGCETIFLVLPTEVACDAVMAGRDDLSGKAIVQLATTSPDYSRTLEQAVTSAGGAYVEAPISGSRVPAERGELVAMLAGEAAAKARVSPLFDPFCAHVLDCGAVPKGIAMKLASNVVLGPLMLGIVEAMAVAERAGLDLDQFGAVLKGGQMASPFLVTKIDKILQADWSPQAGIDNVVTSGGDAVRMAEALGMEDTLLSHMIERVRAGSAAGLGEEDVVALYKLAKSPES